MICSQIMQGRQPYQIKRTSEFHISFNLNSLLKSKSFPPGSFECLLHRHAAPDGLGSLLIRTHDSRKQLQHLLGQFTRKCDHTVLIGDCIVAWVDSGVLNGRLQLYWHVDLGREAYGTACSGSRTSGKNLGVCVIVSDVNLRIYKTRDMKRIWMLRRTYWKLKITVLLDITQGATDDHAGGSKVLCPKRHQSSIAGVNVRQGLGDEDHGVFRDLVNLGTGVSVYTYVYALCADCFRPGHKHSCPAPSERFCPPS